MRKKREEGEEGKEKKEERAGEKEREREVFLDTIDTQEEGREKKRKV